MEERKPFSQMGDCVKVGAYVVPTQEEGTLWGEFSMPIITNSLWSHTDAYKRSTKPLPISFWKMIQGR